MREVEASHVGGVVKDLCTQANTVLRADVLKGLEELYKNEREDAPAKKMLKVLLENARIAREKGLALCQDTGVAAVFIEMGKEIFITGGSLPDAVNKGVKEAYEEGYFRKSVVEDPLRRKNTGTNTPAIIHVDIVGGDKLTISVMPKGFGSENKSRSGMLNPTCKSEEIVDFCVETVRIAGPDACPPYVLGIGLGGTMDSCAYLAKKALLRPINRPNPKEHIALLERDIKEKANALGIGIMGLGGASTVMGVSIEEAPTHIAGCPIAVNVSCHALRSATQTI